VLLIATFGIAYALVARVALHSFPFSGDEYSGFLQAELFARGLLHSPAPPHPELLRVDHVVMDTLVRTKYPPGSAALLAVGVRGGVPWLVGPVEAVVALVALWRTTLTHLGSRAATIAIVVVGGCPLFAFQAASFFAHTATTMWLALAFASMSLWLRTSRNVWSSLAGAAIGCAFLTRPADAIAFAMALAVFRSPAVLACAAIGTAPLVALNFAYQAAQFGSPFADGYHAYEPTFRAIYGADTAAHAMSLTYLFDPKQIANHLDQFRALVQEWTVPGTVLLAVIGACSLGKGHRAYPMRNFAVAAAAIPSFMLLVSIGDPDDGARPRYLSTALLSVGFLAGPGWDATSKLLESLVGPRLERAILVAALVMAPVQLGSFLARRIPELWVREGLFEEVRGQGIGTGVVIVRAEWPTRYARNGPFFDRPILYLSAPAEMTAAQVASLYPGRPVYEAIEGRRWSIVRRL
jgi:hypothetical protein